MTTPALTPISADSVIYVYGTITSPWNPTNDTVQASLLLLGSGDPQESDWQPAEWAPGMTSTLRVLIGPGTDFALSPGNYRLMWRVTDDPEVPVLNSGIIPIV